MKSLKGINNILLIIGVIIIFIAPFIHIEFDKKNKVVDSYKVSLEAKLIKPIEKSLNQTHVKYEKKEISAEDYINKRNNLESKLIQVKKEYKDLVKQKQNENRIFGWLTTRKFLIGFGIRIPYLLFSLIISYLISIINTRDKFLKNTFVFLQISCYSISAYVIIWCFWYSQDYPISSYRFIILFISCLISISIYYFIKYTKQSLQPQIERLKHIIRILFDFILVDSKNEDYVKDNKKDYYKNRSKELIKKALDNE